MSGKKRTEVKSTRKQFSAELKNQALLRGRIQFRIATRLLRASAKTS
mgnify:CR=1 FL=1